MSSSGEHIVVVSQLILQHYLSFLDNFARDLFYETQRHKHCLNVVLPDEENSSPALSPR